MCQFQNEHQGQSDGARAHETRAEELVGGASSLVAARVLAFIARTRAIGGDPAQGLRLATDALALAGKFDDNELRAHSLATIGLAKNYLGDPTGADDEARALEIAVAANSPLAGAIANNVAVRVIFAFEWRRAGELFDEGQRIAERLGDASGVRWLRAQRAMLAFILGRWDEAWGMIEEFIAECEAGSPHYLEGALRRERGRIREARGDVEGALEDHRHTVALGRSASDPQELGPSLGAAIAAFNATDARALSRELVDLARLYPHEAALTVSFDFLLARAALDYELELREVLRDAPHPRWKDLALTCLDRDFVRAAEIWKEGGSPTWEARFRLRAAEELIESGRHAEGEVELGKALAFYRTVGATFFIQRGEQLLAKSA